MHTSFLFGSLDNDDSNHEFFESLTSSRSGLANGKISGHVCSDPSEIPIFRIVGVLK